jgi:hypothetical protein
MSKINERFFIQPFLFLGWIYTHLKIGGNMKLEIKVGLNDMVIETHEHPTITALSVLTIRWGNNSTTCVSINPSNKFTDAAVMTNANVVKDADSC